MKKLFSLLLICCYVTSLVAQQESENDSIYTDDLIEIEINYTATELARIAANREMFPPYANFSYQTKFAIGMSLVNHTEILKILVLVNDSIYQPLEYKILRYAKDIHKEYGCAILVNTVANANHEQLKSIIVQEQEYLNGVVLIGHFPVACYEQIYPDNDGNPTYSNWPCDLYYTDFDGTWQDNNHIGDYKNYYDSHTGNVKPEIFIGRISGREMSILGDEIDIISSYLDKDHAYWVGQLPTCGGDALQYTDRDWVYNPDFYMASISHLYGENHYNSYYNLLRPSYGKEEFLNFLESGDYEFVQLAAHSNPTLHQISTTELTTDSLLTITKFPLGYNLFCCSACDWTRSMSCQINSNQGLAYIGGSYIYGDNTRGLVVVGSTKTGGMQGFKHFYRPLGAGRCVGEAFKSWWINKAGNQHSEREIHWYYGMTILGDPLINFKYDITQNCKDTLTLAHTMSFSHIQFYSAKQKITVKPTFHIPSGTKVFLSAPEIVFEEGFILPYGAEIETDTEGCNNSIMTINNPDNQDFP